MYRRNLIKVKELFFGFYLFRRYIWRINQRSEITDPIPDKHEFDHTSHPDLHLLPALRIARFYHLRSALQTLPGVFVPLLLQRLGRAIDPHKGRLDFPGGFVEHNESAEEAITRELKEELGATVKKLTYFGTFPNQYEFSGMTVFTLDSTFIVELESMSGLKAMDDVAGIEFIRLQDIKPEDIPFTSMKNTITQLQKTRI